MNVKCLGRASVGSLVFKPSCSNRMRVHPYGLSRAGVLLVQLSHSSGEAEESSHRCEKQKAAMLSPTATVAISS